MKALRIVTAGLIAVCLSMVAVVGASQKGKDKDKAKDQDQATSFSAKLAGINEVPSVSTVATGRLKATIADDGALEYELSFSGLQGVVAQSHIHIAQKAVNGGIVLWLCQGTVRAPVAVAALTPECPGAPGGTVTGTLRNANVLAVGTQQIAVNELEEVIALMRAGVAYANVHTNLSPGGEIRGQIRKAEDDDHGGRNR